MARDRAVSRAISGGGEGVLPGELNGEERTLEDGELSGLDSRAADMVAARRRRSGGRVCEAGWNASSTIAWYNMVLATMARVECHPVDRWPGMQRACSSRVKS